VLYVRGENGETKTVLQLNYGHVQLNNFVDSLSSTLLTKSARTEPINAIEEHCFIYCISSAASSSDSLEAFAFAALALVFFALGGAGSLALLAAAMSLYFTCSGAERAFHCAPSILVISN
jgi:hypothetical protein